MDEIAFITIFSGVFIILLFGFLVIVAGTIEDNQRRQKKEQEAIEKACLKWKGD